MRSAEIFTHKFECASEGPEAITNEGGGRVETQS